MRRADRAAAIVLIGICMTSPAWGQEADVLGNADIVTLTEAGLSAAAIVAVIEASGTDFDISVAQLAVLDEAGVESAVIEAMARTSVSPRPGPATAPSASSPPAARPGQSFSDTLSSGGQGPEMVVIPAGRFRMGCVSGLGCQDRELPVHDVTIPRAFAVSKYEVTFEDYDRYTYPNRVVDEGWGRGRRPVINVSWNDAQDYVEWLLAASSRESKPPIAASSDRRPAAMRFLLGISASQHIDPAIHSRRWQSRQNEAVNHQSAKQ